MLWNLTFQLTWYNCNTIVSQAFSSMICEACSFHFARNVFLLRAKKMRPRFIRRARCAAFNLAGILASEWQCDVSHARKQEAKTSIKHTCEPATPVSIESWCNRFVVGLQLSDSRGPSDFVSSSFSLSGDSVYSNQYLSYISMHRILNRKL